MREETGMGKEKMYIGSRTLRETALLLSLGVYAPFPETISTSFNNKKAEKLSSGVLQHFKIYDFIPNSSSNIYCGANNFDLERLLSTKIHIVSSSIQTLKRLIGVIHGLQRSFLVKALIEGKKLLKGGEE